MSKSALIIGIDHYIRKPLRGCVNDAKTISKLLARHEDHRENFDCHLVVSQSPNKSEITKGALIKRLKQLFKMRVETALFYFSGHGRMDEEGLQLVMQDMRENISMLSIMRLVKESTIPKVVIILDCCYAGGAGNLSLLSENHTFLRNGVAILAASSRDEYSLEVNGAGIFTSIIAAALAGEAADLFGNVSVASVYNHADQLLSNWEQRPIFKSYLSSMTLLRECIPRITREELNFIRGLFPHKNYQYLLDASYISTKDIKQENLFKLLRKFEINGLVEAIGTASVYSAAMKEKYCALTQQGKFYWSIINKFIEKNNSHDAIVVKRESLLDDKKSIPSVQSDIDQHINIKGHEIAHISDLQAQNLFESAMQLMKIRNLHPAINLFEKINHLEPDNWYIQKQWGYVLRLGKQYEKAFEKLEIALGLSKSSKNKAKIHIELAKTIIDNRGKVKDVMFHFESAASLDSSNSELYEIWASFYYEQGNYQKSFETIVHSCELEPHNLRYKQLFSFYSFIFLNPEQRTTFNEFKKQKESDKLHPFQVLKSKYQVGDKLLGSVTGINSRLGIFVTCENVRGLIHRKYLNLNFYTNNTHKDGDRINVEILHFNDKNKTITLVLA